MSTLGMDVEEVFALSRKLCGEADRIDDLVRSVGRMLADVEWVGPDADRFRADWQSSTLQALYQVRDHLKDACSSAKQNAEEQQRVAEGNGARDGKGDYHSSHSSVGPSTECAKVPGAAPGVSGPSGPSGGSSSPGQGASAQYSQFHSAYLGKKVDFDGAYGYQCVDLVNKYSRDIFGVSPYSTLGGGNAADIYAGARDTYFEKLGSGGTPKPGDIVCFGAVKGNPYGHIAIVHEVRPDGSYSVMEQNGFRQTPAQVRNISAGERAGVQGFLRPRPEKMAH